MSNHSHSELLSRTGWIFDLDGTLTRPVHDFAHIRAQLGIPADEDILGYIAGQPEALQLSLRQQLDQLEHFYAEMVQPAAGVNDLLDLLNGLGVKLAILTRNTKEVALASLGAIGVADLFEPESVIGRYEAKPKPDPHGVHRILQHWQQTPETAVMVGDYIHDLAVGRAAGTATVHVAVNPDHHWPEQTDLRVDSLAQLYRLLKTIDRP